MKKLKLKALELGATEVLTRAQLRNVLGGTGGDPINGCNYSCIGQGGGPDICTNLCGPLWGCSAYAEVEGTCEHAN